MSASGGRALLVVDVQVDFCEGGALAVDGGAATAAAISGWIGDHHDDYAVIAASRDWHDPDSSNDGHIALPPAEPDWRTTWPVHCIAGTPGADYHPALATDRIDVHVRKGMGSNGYSAFEGVVHGQAANVDLAALLRSRNVTDVDVCGIATDHCVRASGLDARREGFAVRVLGALVAGVDEGASLRALQELRNAGASIEESGRRAADGGEG